MNIENVRTLRTLSAIEESFLQCYFAKLFVADVDNVFSISHLF